MPRTARIYVGNAVSHIITRGIRKQDVFLEENDYCQYLKFLWKYKNRFESKVYAYCLMSNHVHLIIDPSNKNVLPKLMHGLNMAYAMHFNYKYGKCGHLWQNRYKSLPIQKDQYLINALSYVEYNPVRANLHSRAEEYPWSSYKARISNTNDKILDEIKI